MNVLKEPDSRLWRTNFHTHVTVVDFFSFPQKLMPRESLQGAGNICVTNSVFWFSFRKAFHLEYTHPPWPPVLKTDRCPEDWQMSFRLKMCLTTATATSGCQHLHVWFPLLRSWVFPLMFSDSSHSHRNRVWGEIKCLGFCGDHPTPVTHSLIYLTFVHIKSLNFTPTTMQWFPPPLPHAC